MTERLPYLWSFKRCDSSLIQPMTDKRPVNSMRSFKALEGGRWTQTPLDIEATRKKPI